MAWSELMKAVGRLVEQVLYNIGAFEKSQLERVR